MDGITRKSFDMSEPTPVAFGSGTWAFWLTLADPLLYDFVADMPQVSNLHYEDVWQRAMVTISPLYDYEAAWLFIYETLEVETQNTPIAGVWGVDEAALS